MTADSENETGAPKRRGRIPQSAWPEILERYKSGATLSAIAREFDCTPSAISYIVRKAEKSDATGPDEDEAPAPRPVKAESAVTRPAPQPEPEVRAAESAPAQPPRRRDDPPRNDEPRGDRSSGDRTDTVRHEGGRHEGGRNEGGRNEGGRDDRRADQPRDGQQPREGREGRNRLEIGNRPPRDDQGERGRDRGQRFDQNRPDRQERGGRGPERQPRQDRGEPRLDAAEGDIGRYTGDQGYPYHRQRTNPARQEVQESPVAPADERMDAAAKACADLYRAWKENPGEESHQALAGSLHEMRKVLARMEIEMSASRKDEQRPIPIPSYRTNQRAPQQPRG